MDAYHNAPFAHNRTSHLTKLYSDVKQSAVTSLDVKSFLSQQQATENFGALHRKFRIQKDRLVTWGLEWDDEGKGAEGNIDENVARAGLTETVTSVLANVKEVTDELERVRSGVSKPGEKFQPQIFDEERYADLLKDLTASIDTLHDLSRTRRALARGEHPTFGGTTTQPMSRTPSLTKRQSKAPSVEGGEITFTVPTASSRPSAPYNGLPPRINASALKIPHESPPAYEAPGVPMPSRFVAKLLRDKVPEEVQNAMGSNLAEVPVLVEYADFDYAYRQSSTSPPLDRLQDLSRAFPPMRPESQSNISLLCYFEDTRQPRIGLVYDLPYSVQNRMLGTPSRKAETIAPLSLLRMLRKTSKSSTSGDMDAPPLEARFRLALRLTEQLYMLHLQEFPHGNISSSSVLFATSPSEPQYARMKQLKSPLWASFEIFAKQGTSSQAHNIYKHPFDESNTSREDVSTDIKYDLYSFALLLVEIGLWSPLGDLYKSKYNLADFKLRIEKLWIPKLASRCGSAYMRAVQTCIRNVDSGELTIEGLYNYMFDNLRKCCALDEDREDPLPQSPFASNEPQYLSHASARDTGSVTPLGTRGLEPAQAPGSEIDPNALMPAPSLHDFKRRVIQIQRAWRRYHSWIRAIQNISDDEEVARKLSEMENAPTPPAAAESAPKLMEFPLLEIPKAILEDWNNGTAVQLSKIVNKALGGSRESCSINLTSFGESLETARPTYLITCVSTKIVKEMLRRHFRCDPDECYVRVEKGKITRCRRARPISAARKAARSMAPPRMADDFDAANPDYQPQPVCGASIGAYRDEEHLPPASFGGVVVIDGKSYGMSVHHMLENNDLDEDDDNSGNDDDDEEDEDGASMVSIGENAEPLFSDDGSTIRQLSVASDVSIDEETQMEGDVEAIAPGEGLDIEITQPALDDAITQNLHADESEDGSDEEEDDFGVAEDHILSYKLGQVHASSGLKRSNSKGTEDGYKGISASLPQEIDWALFELLPPRVQPYNIVKGGQQYSNTAGINQHDSIPIAVRTSSELAGTSVYCLGRTSGLASGVISSTMDLLKLQGRETFSASWTVHGGFGVGGDSGAWVISSDGKVCGHVLAERGGRTYICPMDLLFDDMKATLGAASISLPVPLEGKKGAWFIQQDVVTDAVSKLRINESDEGMMKASCSPSMQQQQQQHSQTQRQHDGNEFIKPATAPMQSAR